MWATVLYPEVIIDATETLLKGFIPLVVKCQHRSEQLHEAVQEQYMRERGKFIFVCSHVCACTQS